MTHALATSATYLHNVSVLQQQRRRRRHTRTRHNVRSISLSLSRQHTHELSLSLFLAQLKRFYRSENWGWPTVHNDDDDRNKLFLYIRRKLATTYEDGIRLVF